MFGREKVNVDRLRTFPRQTTTCATTCPSTDLRRVDRQLDARRLRLSVAVGVAVRRLGTGRSLVRLVDEMFVDRVQRVFERLVQLLNEHARQTADRSDPIGYLMRHGDRLGQVGHLSENDDVVLEMSMLVAGLTGDRVRLGDGGRRVTLLRTICQRQRRSARDQPHHSITCREIDALERDLHDQFVFGIVDVLFARRRVPERCRHARVTTTTTTTTNETRLTR
jgi:hypothetical protein